MPINQVPVNGLFLSVVPNESGKRLDVNAELDGKEMTVASVNAYDDAGKPVFEIKLFDKLKNELAVEDDCPDSARLSGRFCGIDDRFIPVYNERDWEDGMIPLRPASDDRITSVKLQDGSNIIRVSAWMMQRRPELYVGVTTGGGRWIQNLFRVVVYPITKKKDGHSVGIRVQLFSNKERMYFERARFHI